MRLLQEAPASVLWLLADAPVTENNLRREASARGIADERLVFADRIDIPGYLGRLALADLFLDCQVSKHRTYLISSNGEHNG